MLFYLAYFFVQWEVEIASGNIGFIQIPVSYTHLTLPTNSLV